MLNFFRFRKKDKNPIDDEESPELLEISERLSKIESTTVKEIMVPRIDVVSVSINSTFKETIEVIQEHGHSRIPVWDKSVDDIIGILYVKDLLPFFFQENPDIDFKKLIRTAYFVPESKKILSLLKEIQVNKNHLAIIVDEYGGVSGIVALEDILEEIVGEIQDEHDNEEEPIIKITDRLYILDSRVYMQDLNENFDLDLPTENFETIGGFVLDLFGRIPEQNESIDFSHVDFTIAKIDGNRILKIKMKINDKLNDIEDEGLSPETQS